MFSDTTVDDKIGRILVWLKCNVLRTSNNLS